MYVVGVPSLQYNCSILRLTLVTIFPVIAEVDLQKLSHALKILSDTEKQLRMSKNQTTWLTVALLQLSSVDFSSLDANNSKLWLENTPEKGVNHYFFRGVNMIQIVYLGNFHLMFLF